MKVKRFMSGFISLVMLFSLCTSLPVSAATSAELSISQNGIEFICGLEGFHSTCYKDNTQSSIGYGTKCTGSSTQPHAAGSHSITREKAMSDMKSQIENTYSPRVRKQTAGLTMNQNQFDALVSLCYNCGGGTTKISNSPLVRYLRGELTETDARNLYSSYIVTSGGKVLQGLINRRNKEADLFFSDGTVPPPPPEGCFEACAPGHTSLVEALKSIGVDSSYDNRKRIAIYNGITDYSGTASQNTSMLNSLKNGTLMDPDYQPDIVPDPDPEPEPPESGYFPACSSGYASIVEALKSIDVDSSYDNRKRIAIKNGITNYSGTAEQNTQLLSLLKSGKLLDPDYVQPVTTTTTTTTTTTKKTTTATTTTTKKTTTTTTTTTTKKTTTTTTTTTTKKTTTTTTTTEPKEPIILPHELTIQIGDTAELVVLNCDKPEDIQWISSNKNVAEVKDGVVSGKSVGETTIYAVVNNVYCEAVVIVEEKVSETRPTGDANQDGKVLLNDAVLILQYLGNPDAYPLSDEAKANADVSGNGDGITNKDALAIQRFVLHLIPSLPES